MSYSSGIDIVSISRFEGLSSDPAFLARLLTEEELGYVLSKPRGLRKKHLAGRFASKEAVMKALGTGWDHGVGWRDIEVRNAPSGGPSVVLHRGALAAAGGGVVQLSISYTKDVAAALAIMEGRAEGHNELRNSNTGV